MRGRFIVVEGIDGNGKSTQSKLLARWLKKKGILVLLTHEPSRKTALGKKITKLTKSKKLSSEKWLELFTKEREEHLRIEIMPALKKGITVISDRYYYSTLAYQLPESRWKSYARRLMKPDLTLIFDAPEKIAMKRITKSRKHSKRAIFENENFLKTVRKKYLKMGQFREVRIIDAKPAPEKVFEEVKAEVKKIL